MDAVYILGSGSKADNLELFISIALLKKHCVDLKNIYVVGDDPGFKGDYIHLPAEDHFTDEWKNVLSKIKKAIAELPLTEKFLLMNDDFFANAPFEGDSLPYYAVNGEANDINGKYNFGIHAPYVIERELFKSMPLDVFAPKNTSIRSFYGNYFKCEPEFVKDTIMIAGAGVPSYDEQIAGKPWFSTDDHIFTLPDFVDWIKNKVGEDLPEISSQITTLSEEEAS